MRYKFTSLGQHSKRSLRYIRETGDALVNEPRKFAFSDVRENNRERRKTWLILTAKSRHALLPPSNSFFRGSVDPTTSSSTSGGRARCRFVRRRLRCSFFPRSRPRHFDNGNCEGKVSLSLSPSLSLDLVQNETLEICSRQPNPPAPPSALPPTLFVLLPVRRRRRTLFFASLIDDS